MTELINCGQKIVQTGFRIVIRKTCKNNDIKEGDTVEIFIKKVVQDGIS
ncbi:MAG: hypothetical protein ACT6FG_00310 [Methanosarcinaceae archaeon]